MKPFLSRSNLSNSFLISGSSWIIDKTKNIKKLLLSNDLNLQLSHDHLPERLKLLKLDVPLVVLVSLKYSIDPDILRERSDLIRTRVSRALAWPPVMMPPIFFMSFTNSSVEILPSLFESNNLKACKRQKGLVLALVLDIAFASVWPLVTSFSSFSSHNLVVEVILLQRLQNLK